MRPKVTLLLLLTIFWGRVDALPGEALPGVAAVATSPLVTLHTKDSPVSAVLAQVTSQTGVRVMVMPSRARGADPEPTVTLNVDQEPFWSVVRQICRQTGLTPQGLADGLAAISLAPGTVTLADQPVCVVDGFLIALEQASRKRALLLDSNAVGGSLELQLRIYAPPGARLYAATVPTALEAVTLDGRSLVPASSPAGMTSSGSLRWITSAVLPLQPGDLPAGQRLARLRGTLRLATEGPMESLTVEPPFEQPVERRLRTGETLTLGVGRTADGVVVTVDTGAEDRSLLRILGQSGARIRLGDGQNRDTTRGEFEPTSTGFRQRFLNVTELPARVVIDLPPLRTLPFEFKDLPLP